MEAVFLEHTLNEDQGVQLRDGPHAGGDLLFGHLDELAVLLLRWQGVLPSCRNPRVQLGDKAEGKQRKITGGTAILRSSTGSVGGQCEGKEGKMAS